MHDVLDGTVVALDEGLVNALLGEVTTRSALLALTSLVGSSHHLNAVVSERVLGTHHAHWLHRHLRLLRVGRSVREQSLVDLQERSLVVNEEIKNMRLVLWREIADLDSVLSELG